jgi:phospholipid/cholesterol/gamma-HCH transport system substrate-binding protein
MRRVNPGISPQRAAVLGLLIIAIATYFIFTKSVPFRHHYEIRAVVANSNLLTKRNPVRISGIDVGQITSVGRYGHTNDALVTMRIDDNGRPVHRDATLKIWPRLFLEGNFYIDLSPGTPDSPEMPDGGLIPLSHTARPVQIDQLLSALTSDVRRSLQQTLQGFGAALDSTPTAADNANQDRQVRGLTGAQAINKTLGTSPQALRDSAIVSDALAGPYARTPGDPYTYDLATTIRGFAAASGRLELADSQLAPLVADFDTTMRATASQAANLRATVSQLGPAARSALAGFTALDSALPATSRFARDLATGLPEIPATISAAYPWLAQSQPLLSQAELGGLLSTLAPATGDLARLGHATRQFLPQIDAFNQCVTKVILPTGNIAVADGPLSTSVPNYQEFWYSMVGQAAEGQGADGNGNFLRIAAAGGSHTLETGQSAYTGAPLFAQAVSRPLSTRPAYPNSVPPLRRDIPCAGQGVPDVNGAASTGAADGTRPNAPPPPLPNDPTGIIKRASTAQVTALPPGSGR